MAQSGSVRDVLRVQTRETHQQLHEHQTFVGLFDQSLTLEQYRDLVAYFYGFYAALDVAIELCMADMDTPTSGYTYAARAHFLAQDLMDLGTPKAEIQSMSICTCLDDVVTTDTLGGVIYVVEGSTLGAGPIDRAARALLGRDDTRGRSFWAWCRAKNSQRWAQTNRYLDELQAAGTPLHGFERGANQTFQSLADWLHPLDDADTVKAHA